MNSNKSSNEIIRLIHAFGYSWQGFKFACAQPAFRTELLAAAIMIPLAFAVSNSGVERALLIGSIILVMIVELLNTGIEKAIDRISPEWHEISKQAKDVASAAVLFSLLNAAVVWLMIVFS